MTRSDIAAVRRALQRPRTAAITAATVLMFGAVVRLVTHTGYASDLGRYYAFRDLRPGVIPYLDRALEYPVVSGIVIGLVGQVTTNARVLLVLNAALLALLAATLAWFLAKRYGDRVAWFAIAPTLAIAGPVSWDLVAVVPATLAIVAFVGGSTVVAGVLLGIGIAAKVFPALFLVPMVVERLRHRQHTGALALVGIVCATVAIINVPVALAAPNNWRFFFTFQSGRAPTWGTVSYYIFSVPVDGWQWLSAQQQSTLGTMTMLAVTAVVTAWSAFRVWRGEMSAVAAMVVTLIAFLLSNKVYSPQYDLWVIPFFVLLPFTTRAMCWFFAADAVMFVTVFGVAPLLRGGPVDAVWFVGTVVALRAVVLLVLARQAWSMGADAGISPAAHAARLQQSVSDLRHLSTELNEA